MNDNILSQIPNEFLDKIKTYLSDIKYNEFIESFNKEEQKGLVLNINKLKTNKVLFDEIIDTLNLKLFYENNNYSYYFYNENDFKNDKSVGNQIYHHQGLYYIQEPSASMVIKNVDIKDNDKILDLCSAPGGKSIDSLLNNFSGFVISNDIDIKRAKITSSNIERLGFSNCIVTNNNPIYFSNNYKSYFDKVILDAPCSGEGMMRKNESARLQWNTSLVNKMSNIQKELIDIAYECVKNDGIIIYSTCTFSKEEDEDIIEYITNKHSNLEILKTQKIYFQDDIGEGQFFAILKKNVDYDKSLGISDYKNYQHNTKQTISKLSNNKKTLNEFINIFKETIDYDIVNDNNINLILLNNKIYAVDKSIPINDIKDLNILRIGIELAEINNNNISLSHSITHSIYSRYFRHKIDLSIEDCYKYLKGDSFNVDLDLKSFALVTYKEIALGLCKITNKTLKNHYPKGLRLLN